MLHKHKETSMIASQKRRCLTWVGNPDKQCMFVISPKLCGQYADTIWQRSSTNHSRVLAHVFRLDSWDKARPWDQRRQQSSQRCLKPACNDHLINMESCLCPVVHIYLAGKVIHHVTGICDQLYTHNGVWKHAMKHILGEQVECV